MDDEKALLSSSGLIFPTRAHSRADALLILVLLGLSPGGAPSMNGGWILA